MASKYEEWTEKLMDGLFSQDRDSISKQIVQMFTQAHINGKNEEITAAAEFVAARTGGKTVVYNKLVGPVDAQQAAKATPPQGQQRVNIPMGDSDAIYVKFMSDNNKIDLVFKMERDSSLNLVFPSRIPGKDSCFTLPPGVPLRQKKIVIRGNHKGGGCHMPVEADNFKVPWVLAEDDELPMPDPNFVKPKPGDEPV